MPQKKEIILGADHAGFDLKEILKADLTQLGYPVQDLTPILDTEDDYPIPGKQLGKQLAKNPNGMGILICGTGFGIAMAANRVKGIRAAVIRTPEEAVMAREHNHANVLVLGGGLTKPATAKKILQSWLSTTPSKAARHARRVQQLDSLV